MLSEYRQRFCDYHTRLHEEIYLYRSGRKSLFDRSRLYGEFSDLFEVSTVRELRERLNGVSELRRSERAGISRLISFATIGNMFGRVIEIDAEIEGYESPSKIDRDGDLRAERWEILTDASSVFGYENYLAACRTLLNFDDRAMVVKATGILQKTEEVYVASISPLIAQRTGRSMAEAASSDLEGLGGSGAEDRYFTPGRMFEAYRELFAGLGFRTENQSNIEIEPLEAPLGDPVAFTAALHIPDEIKLVVNPIGGSEGYADFFRASGRAQHAAWTSRELAPEFQRFGDRGVIEAWGMLLKNLIADQNWLGDFLGFFESDDFRRARGILRLMGIRRESAQLIYETEFHGGILPGRESERYLELHSEALRVRSDPTGYLRSVTDDLHPDAILRGCAFETQLREHLKSKYGSRWWESRKAGDMLIDLWNTGLRYSAEELASMIGLGRLDFDWLAAELVNFGGE